MFPTTQLAYLRRNPSRKVLLSAVTSQALGQKHRSTHHQSLGTPAWFRAGMQLVEVEDALAERHCASLVLCSLSVPSESIRWTWVILPLSLSQQFQRPAGQRLFLADLVGADGGAHVGVAGVEEHAEVGVAPIVAHGLDQGKDLRRLVEGEARLEFPADAHAVVGRQLGADVQRPHGAVEADRGRDAQLLDLGDVGSTVSTRMVSMPRSSAKNRFLAKAAMYGPLSSTLSSFCDHRSAASAGEFQAVVLDFLLQLLPLGLRLQVSGPGCGLNPPSSTPS